MNNKMAVNPIYKIFFKKASFTFEDAADDFRLAVGSIARIGNGLPGPKPNYLNLEEGKIQEYREHLLQCFGALWDYLSGEDREVLRQFEGSIDNLTKKELLRLGGIILRHHQKIRKFRTPEELTEFGEYLEKMVYSENGAYRPTIISGVEDNEALFYYEPASRQAWIAIEKTKSGFVVEGEADFLSIPDGVRRRLISDGYKFDVAEIRLSVSREVFLRNITETFKEFKMTARPNGEMRFDFGPDSPYKWLAIEKVRVPVEGKEDDDEYYVVKAEKAVKQSHGSARQQRKKRDPSAGKPGRLARPKKKK